MTLRFMMQTLGTPWGRDTIHPGIWTMQSRFKAQSTLRSYSVIFDDMRHPDEFTMLKDMGGKAIKLIRPNNAGGDASIGEGMLDQHSFDHTIINDGDLSQLQGRVGALIRESLGPQADMTEWQ